LSEGILLKTAVRLVAIPLALLAFFSWVTAEDKMKTEELVAKHLASIGAPEARAAARSRVLRGDAQVTFVRGGAGTITGKGNILSEGRLFRFGMNFNAPNYPSEQLAYDGKDVGVGWLRPGERSQLCDLLNTQSYVIREGLWGGTLSTAWPLLNLAEREARLDYRGLKKLEERQLHEVLYRPKKGGAFQILLYFDEENFRHVRTQYRLARPYVMGSRPGQNADARDTIHLVIEDFSDFKSVDSLTLPHSYRISHTIEGTSVTALTKWSLTVTELGHNQQLDPKYFSIK